MNYSKCPICDSYLLKRYITEKFEYNGKQITIPNYKIFKCLGCNEEYVPTETIQQTEEILKNELEVKQMTQKIEFKITLFNSNNETKQFVSIVEDDDSFNEITLTTLLDTFGNHFAKTFYKKNKETINEFFNIEVK